jgi:hypothetical protein
VKDGRLVKVRLETWQKSVKINLHET